MEKGRSQEPVRRQDFTNFVKLCNKDGKINEIPVLKTWLTILPAHGFYVILVLIKRILESLDMDIP